MGNKTRMMFDDDELFTLEMALMCYQTVLDGYDDGKTAMNGEYGRAGRLLQQAQKALGETVDR